MAIASSPGPRIAHVGAISLGTPDLETSLNFFRDLLGMEEVQRVGDTVYLRGYQELKHHSLVLFASEKPIVDSYSFRVGRPEDVELYSQELKEQDIEVLELPRGHQAGRGTGPRLGCRNQVHGKSGFATVLRGSPSAWSAHRSEWLRRRSSRLG